MRTCRRLRQVSTSFKHSFSTRNPPRAPINTTNFVSHEYLNGRLSRMSPAHSNLALRFGTNRRSRISRCRRETRRWWENRSPPYAANTQTITTTSHSLPCWWRDSRWATTIVGIVAWPRCRWLMCAFRLRSYLELNEQWGQLKDGAFPHSYSMCRFSIYAFL